MEHDLITAEKGLERALALAYRSLGTRQRTVAELRDLLERRGTDAEIVEPAMAELIGAGLLDDERYARAFADDKRRLDGWGSERITCDLARRGVAATVIEAAVASLRGNSEREAGAALLARRFPSALEGDRDRDRAWRLLMRRGYAPELAYDVVRAHRAGELGTAPR